MKLIKWLKHLGEGVCEISCEKCKNDPGQPFYHDMQCEHNNGMCVCPSCGNVWPEKDIEGANISEESRQIVTAQNPDTGERVE